MYSFSKIALNAEIVQAVLTEHFGSASVIDKFEELKDGFLMPPPWSPWRMDPRGC